MSETTNLGLFKHDNPSTNTNPFNVDKALNQNWDKVDGFAGKIITALTNNKSTSTGTNITINDSAEARVEEIHIRGNSVQATRDGKNLINTEQVENSTVNGITFTRNDDGSILINGTSTQNVIKNFPIDIVIPAGDYTLYIPYSSSTSGLTVSLGYDGKITGTDIQPNQSNHCKNITFSKDTAVNQLRTYTNSGVTINNYLLKWMLIKGTYTAETIPEYEPYGVMPSPDYPSEINSCGDNVNLLQNTATTKTENGVEFTINNDGTVIVNGTATAATSLLINNSLTLKNGTYVLSGCPKGGSSSTYRFRLFRNNSSAIAETGDGISFEITDTITFNYLDICIQAGTTLNNLIFKPKLVKGTKATSYTEYGIGCINETICNENLLNKDNINKNKFISSTGTLSDNDVWDSSDFIKIETSETITISGDINDSSFIIAQYDNTQNFISKEQINSVKSVTRTLGTTTKYIRIAYRNDRSLQEIKLEKGTVVTPHIEHKSQTYTIPTQKPFRAIGDYKDTFVKQDGVWYERHYIGEIIFDGTESWKTATIEETYSRFYVNINNKRDSGGGRAELLSNMFVPRRFNDVYKEDIEGIAEYIGTNADFYKNIYLKTLNTNISSTETITLTLFKAKLVELYNAGTPITIYFVLATPIYIPCTTEQTIKLNEIQALAKTYKNTTHIFSEDEVSPEIEVTYLKDIATMLGGV